MGEGMDWEPPSGVKGARPSLTPTRASTATTAAAAGLAGGGFRGASPVRLGSAGGVVGGGGFGGRPASPSKGLQGGRPASPSKGPQRPQSPGGLRKSMPNMSGVASLQPGGLHGGVGGGGGSILAANAAVKSTTQAPPSALPHSSSMAIYDGSSAAQQQQAMMMRSSLPMAPGSALGSRGDFNRMSLGAGAITTPLPQVSQPLSQYLLHVAIPI